MSDHLPECFCTDTPLKPKKVRGLCICDRLRACEARVADLANTLLNVAVAEARAEVVTVNLEGDFNYVKGYNDSQRDEWESLPADSVAEGVRLLQTIGLDITYTDEGLAVIARQLIRMGQRDERAKWSVLIKDRIRDLQSCLKHDDCMGKADILLVILDDYDYANGVTDE